MLTPQEVRENACFEKVIFGGYSVSAVDEYVTALIADYAELYKENGILQSKLNVVNDRLNSYSSQESDMKRVLLAAQKTADDMVAETERKCARMMSETEQNLRERNEDLRRELAAEGARVMQAKKTANAFVTDIENRLQWYLAQLERIKQMNIVVPKQAEKQEPTAEEKPAAAEAPAAPAAEEQLPEAPAEETAEPAEAIEEQPEAPAEETEPVENDITRVTTRRDDPEVSGDTRVIPIITDEN